MNKNGFTLIELSIVLIIISMVIGGIVGGRTLIHNAELNKVMTEVNNYKTSIMQFKDKYDYLPGDFPYAFDHWPSAGCTDVWVGSSTAGCNGDGNRQIFSFPGKEQLRAWQHLNLAQFISQSFTGELNGTDYTYNVNIPESSIKNSGYIIRYDATNTYGELHNNIMFGAKSGPAFLWAPVFNSPDAHKIDKKLDNGVAFSGKIVSVDGYDGTATTTGCVDNGTTIPSNYDLSNMEIKCRMHFFID